jgi:hypothetical protein
MRQKTALCSNSAEIAYFQWHAIVTYLNETGRLKQIWKAQSKIFSFAYAKHHLWRMISCVVVENSTIHGDTDVWR